MTRLSTWKFPSTPRQPRLVDIGVNLDNRSFRKQWREVVQRSIDAGVDRLILTGVDMKSSKSSLNMADVWRQEYNTSNLFVTIGVHPHNAKFFDDSTEATMRELLENPLAVAVGECGLDYNRNYSSKEDQLRAFRRQVLLACELQKPLFVHEREAHQDLIQVLEEIESDTSIAPLPPLVIHCFTGTLTEAQLYISKGFYLSFAGTICKSQRGAPLRELLPHLPLDRIMVETDAPFMGFVKGRKGSEPADTAGVAATLAQTMGCSMEDACKATTNNAVGFFGLESSSQA